jgi:hypothetical protein
MTRSIGRRAGVVAALAALATTTCTVLAAPAGAAGKNACKVLKRSEIQQAFGGTVTSGRQGIGTPVSAQCEFQVSAYGDRPAGTVTVHVLTKGGKAADARLEKTGQYAPLDGVASSLYAENSHVVDVLQGDVLLGVQGGFVITDPLPIHFYDDKTPLTGLARIGAKRV